MSRDSDQAAENKGAQDFNKSGGVASDPLTEAFHPTYNPPSGHEDQYKAGWDNAKSQK